jgi:hypothetical protein
MAAGKCFSISTPGKSKGKNPSHRESRNPDNRNPKIVEGVDEIGYFGTSVPRIPKCVFPCARESRDPDLRNPKMITYREVSILQHFNTWNT